MDFALYKYNSISKLSLEAIKLNVKYLELTDRIKVLEKSLNSFENYCKKFLKPENPLKSFTNFSEKITLIRKIKSIQSELFLLRSDIDEIDKDFSLLCEFCNKLKKGEETPELPYKFAIKCMVEDYF